MGAPIPPMHDARADGWGVSFPNELSPFFIHEPFVPGKAYPYGTILMWNSPHIAIVLHSDGSNHVQVFEQNADPNGAPCQVSNREVNNVYHTCTYALIPKVEAPVTQPPYTLNTDNFPRKMQLKVPTHKWDLGYRSFADVNAHPIPDGSNQIWQAGYIFDAVAEYHSTAPDLQHYTYYATDTASPGAFNSLDCIDYREPVPYVPPAAPVPIKLAKTVDIVTSIPYYASSLDALTEKNPTGNLGATTYYVYGEERGMWNLTSSNGKDLQHWVNPADNVVKVVPPTVSTAAPDIQVPPPIRKDDSWKSSFVSFNPQRKPVKYIMLKNYGFKDVDGYSKAVVQRNVGDDVPFSGTFVKDSTNYARVYVANPLTNTLDDKRWFACPWKDENGQPVIELEQAVYDQSTDIVTRKAQKNLQPRDYLILVAEAVDSMYSKTIKSIDGVFSRRKK